MTVEPIEAAVLVPVVKHAGETTLIFIVRTDFGPHARQVAFPGGQRAPQDASLEETALREFEEELGVPCSVVKVVETLPVMETLSTGFRVTPVVAGLEGVPEWTPDPREVERVLEIPLDVLRDEANRHEATWDGQRYPGIRVGQHIIWGLTYRILERLIPRLSHPGGEPMRNRKADSGMKRSRFVERKKPAPYRQWGDHLEPQSVRQMEAACRLPVAVRGALMPDAHLGYGLPIGGVLAVKNAVIPYAVGVDIACRVQMSVLDLPLDTLTAGQSRLKSAIDRETNFGIGGEFRPRRRHGVMDEDWSVSPVTRSGRNKAWAQLGTSGSGNHFVEFGELLIEPPEKRGPGRGLDLEPGRYLALLSHSGSRGIGASVARHYSRLAMSRHADLPPDLKHLAWLDLDSAEGQEYWAAMELMGKYASANHDCIHRHVVANLGAEVLLDLENHHNFAWKERHDDRDVIVHRKGATPAGTDVLGIIPGSMATATYVVRGLGSEDALRSAAHGAGRVMSRTQAKKTFRWPEVQRLLDERGVRLLSAGLDEVPMVYKDIDAVMRAQADLVEPVARFRPRLVKMAPSGERPED